MTNEYWAVVREGRVEERAIMCNEFDAKQTLAFYKRKFPQTYSSASVKRVRIEVLED